MKTLLFTLLLLAGVSMAKAQLANTKWTGTMYVPTDTQVTLDFKKDSVEMIINENNFIGETMAYTIKDDVITLKKLSGNSPCGIDTFTVKYIVKDGKLLITPLADSCEDRTHSWASAGYTKVK